MHINFDKEDSDETLFNQKAEDLLSKESDKENNKDFLGTSLYVPILVIVEGENLGQRYILSKSEIIIGRKEECEIFLLDNLVSRQHCRLKVTPGQKDPASISVVLEDLNSRNGTIVNSRKITGPCVLEDGDKIQIGKFLFCYFTKLKEEIDLEDHLLKLAQKDFLTGLYNRQFFIPTFEFEFKRYKRFKFPLSVIMFDIDNFKQVNDTYGHEAGDQVLKEISAIIKSEIRTCDLAVRYGGEEFIEPSIRGGRGSGS